MFIGGLLIILGVIWLLRNLGVVSIDFWEVFLPSVVILLGLKITLLSVKWGQWWNQWRKPFKGKGKIKIE